MMIMNNEQYNQNENYQFNDSNYIFILIMIIMDNNLEHRMTTIVYDLTSLYGTFNLQSMIIYDSYRKYKFLLLIYSFII